MNFDGVVVKANEDSDDTQENDRLEGNMSLSGALATAVLSLLAPSPEISNIHTQSNPIPTLIVPRCYIHL